MISFDEALALVRAAAAPIGTEKVSLDEAASRVLASAVTAGIDSPRSAVSAMDGYAIRDSDLTATPARLNVVGESFAGRRWHGAIQAGECVRIFTGAPVPDGADRVVMQENVERDGEWAVINAHPGAATHIRKRGGDFAAGDVLVPSGRVLGARALVAAAGADMAQLEVSRRPTVRILSTGDELAEPGSAAASEDRIPESVSIGVGAMATAWGAQVLGRKRLADDLEAMKKAAVTAAEEADVVVVTGGASVGDKDFAKPMFEPAGLELVFSKVAIKPGKPVWLGRAGKALVVGLPGNPTSALVTARLFLVPLLAGITGRKPDLLEWRQLPLGTALPASGGRETFHRARRSQGRAEILSFQDSSAQKALVDADLLVRQRPHSEAMAPGTMVEVLDF